MKDPSLSWHLMDVGGNIGAAPVPELHKNREFWEIEGKALLATHPVTSNRRLVGISQKRGPLSRTMPHKNSS